MVSDTYFIVPVYLGESMRGLLGLVGAFLVGFSVALVGMVSCPYMGKLLNHNCSFCVDKCNCCVDKCNCCKPVDR